MSLTENQLFGSSAGSDLQAIISFNLLFSGSPLRFLWYLPYWPQHISILELRLFAWLQVNILIFYWKYQFRKQNSFCNRIIICTIVKTRQIATWSCFTIMDRKFTAKMGQMGWIGSVFYLAAPKRPPWFWFFQLPWVPNLHFSWNPLLSGRPHFSCIIIHL